ncbi:transposase [Sphaerospermopsis sp. LEGE 00249]|uniref:transposase n=1 Tax=Sphaerospermopsis sp. LEGE 00249 TaxID=1380707 RepID=UPI00164E621E|nr:transposase [Sphaerospermopsis sp. LEGE 00249]MBC5794668.1 transposase [Sphaerospermopsis sp. LEGE 00249]
MPYNPEIHHRRSIRLKGYDYSQIGAYFVTICTHHRNCLFGEIVDGEMKLNTNGEVARGCWLSIPRHFQSVELDEFLIMPNHVHGIIIIVNSEAKQDFSQSFSDGKGEALAKQDFSQSFSDGKGEALANFNYQQQQNLSSQCFAPTVPGIKQVKINGTKPQSLAAIIQNYKSVSTRRVNRINKAQGNVIWQRNFHEHIIRNEEELKNIRQYIVNNPINWAEDEENPVNVN